MDTIGKVGVIGGTIATVIVIIIVAFGVMNQTQTEMRTLIQNTAKNEVQQFVTSTPIQKQKFAAERQALDTAKALVNQHIAEFNNIPEPTQESRDQINREITTLKIYIDDYNQHLDAANEIQNQTRAKMLQDIDAAIY